jgi:hypothetical protein
MCIDVPDVRNGWKAAIDLDLYGRASMKMLTVHTAPTVERKQGGWEIALWLGRDFDWSTPFRASLAEIARVLGCKATALELPPYVPDEDFVEGTYVRRQSGSRVFRVFSWVSVADERRPRLA